MDNNRPVVYMAVAKFVHKNTGEEKFFYYGPYDTPAKAKMKRTYRLSTAGGTSLLNKRGERVHKLDFILEEIYEEMSTDWARL